MPTALPAIAGAVVMATGIVSIDFELDGRQALSMALLAIAAAAWLLLVALLAATAASRRVRPPQWTGAPEGLTSVAGTAVLGTRVALLGWSAVAAVLLALAVGLWLVLAGPVAREWAVPTRGASFMVAVAPQGLAALGATLAEGVRAGWLVAAALAPLALGLASYALVLARFDARQLGVGRGDQWVAGGALAISALAAASVTLAARRLHVLGGATAALQDVAIALWALSLAWLPLLVAAEVVRPRPGYAPARWSTVFPLGMYAACSFAVGSAAHAAAVTRFAQVWTWPAFAAWLIVVAGLLRRSAVRPQPPRGPCRS